MTDYYDVGGAPADGSHGDSVVIRNEFKAVQDGISKKLPVINGNSGKVVVINAGATKMETAATTGTGDFVRGTSPTFTTPTLNSPTFTTPILGTPVSGDATNLTNTIAPQTNAATSKATPVDADAVPLIDSAASFGLKKLTWANLKAALSAQLTSLSGLTTPLSIPQGGTGATTAAAARTAIDAPSNADLSAINGFRNVVMNGNMAISQEFGTASTTITAGAALKYVVDGWYAACTGANVTVQQVITNNKASLVVTGLAANTGVTLGHRIESADSYSMAGLFATLSLLVSSSALTTVNWGLYYANSKDAFGTIAVPTRTLIQTGSFTGITSTAALKSAITSAALAAGAHTGLEIVISVPSLLGAQTLTITDVQLEKGSIAVPVFENLEAPRQRLRCEWVYKKGSVLQFNAPIYAASNVTIPLPMWRMRAAPTIPALTNITSNEGTAYTASSNTTHAQVAWTTAAVGTAQISFDYVLDARL